MIAQLEVSLTVGEQYHFQVRGLGDVTHLKVIGEQLKQQALTNMYNLLEQLGLKASKLNVALLQALISQKVPFTKEQLQRAVLLLHGAKNKTKARQLLKEMISSGLPITDLVFQALAVSTTNGMTDQMHSLLQVLRQAPNPTQIHKGLINRLSQMIEQPPSSKVSFINQLSGKEVKKNQELFNVLKSIGSLDSAAGFTNWKPQSEFLKPNNFSTTNIDETLFQLNRKRIKQIFEQMRNQDINIRTVTLDILQNWSHEFETSITKGFGYIQGEFHTIKATGYPFTNAVVIK